MTMRKPSFIACDLGAESGRVMLGTLGDGHFSLEEIHRFPTEHIRVNGSLRLNMLGIFKELKIGMRKVADRGIATAGISVDSWGADYVLVGQNQPMLAAPVFYRDERNDKAFQATLESIPRTEIFEQTGVQFMPFNTIYQLAAELESSPKLVGLTEKFLLIADYLNYLFSGRMVAERSLASTTQLYNPRTHAWVNGLINRLGLDENIFPQIVETGTRLGPLLPSVAEETGLAELEVIATCSHDTGAAVAAVPSKENENWAYLSSGTWSLIGIELSAPLINDRVQELNFTNEVGYGGTIRFLKNIVGLWLVQECRKSWLQQGNEFTYSDLTRLADEAEPLRSLIDPRSARFHKAGSMPEKIINFCKETDQPLPQTPGQIVRCALESLALMYRLALAEIEMLTGRKIDTLYIVGGGSSNQLLNQFASDATQREVIAGPAEATATGNILIQALALGHLESLWEVRHMVRRSSPLQRFHPGDAGAWHRAFERLQSITV